MAQRKSGGRPRGTEPLKGGKHRDKVFRVYSDEELETLADELYEWFQDETHFWIKEFGIERMLYAQRISEFAERNEYFRAVLTVCKEIQEARLMRLGMNPDMKPTMPIFALKNVAGWRDQSVSLEVPTGKRLVIEDAE